MLKHISKDHQELVHLVYIDGMEHAPAFEKVYPNKNWSLQAKRTEVQDIFKQKAVQKYIKELQDDLRKEKIMSIVDKLEWLESVINDPNEKMRDRIKALEVANKLQGHDAPTKIENSGNLSLSINPIVDEAIERLLNS